jgi:membrane-associated phospholipid phosphatase
MKSLLIILISSFSFCYSQNVDINMLKNINGSYTTNGGKTMLVVTNSVNVISLGLPVGLFIAGKATKNKEVVWDSYELLSSTVVNGIFTTSLKFGVQRERPFVTYPNDIVKYTKAGSHSFPSGHTSMAFATAMSMSLMYPKWYVIVPSFVWASSVGYSRMYLGVHYPSDVFAGAFLGCASSVGTHYLFKYLRKKYMKPMSAKLSLL